MVIIVIYLTSFGIMEPEDEWLCKAVLILIDTYQNPRLNRVTQQYTEHCLTQHWGLSGILKHGILKLIGISKLTGKTEYKS